MGKTRIQVVLLIVLAVALFSHGTDSSAGTPLQEKLNFQRLIGRWVSTTDDGRTFELAYSWRLKKHVMISRFKQGGYAGFGLTYFDRTKDKIMQIGVDSLGGVGRGQWQADGEKVVWKTEYVSPDGTHRKMAVVHTFGADKTMKMEYYRLDEKGEIGLEPTATHRFGRKAKRDKKQQAANEQPPGRNQESELSDLVAQLDFDWLLGNWTTTTNDRKLDTSYKWDMSRQIIGMTLKVGDYEGMGMMFYDPAEGKVMQVGADNRGGLATGFWDARDDKPVAWLEYVDPNGRSMKVAATHKRVDDETMEVTYDYWYDSAEQASLGLGPIAVKVYKRQAKKPAGKPKAAAPTKTK